VVAVLPPPSKAVVVNRPLPLPQREVVPRLLPLQVESRQLALPVQKLELAPLVLRLVLRLVPPLVRPLALSKPPPLPRLAVLELPIFPAPAPRLGDQRNPLAPTLVLPQAVLVLLPLLFPRLAAELGLLPVAPRPRLVNLPLLEEVEPLERLPLSLPLLNPLPPPLLVAVVLEV
jgi:hypothetical protein